MFHRVSSFIKVTSGSKTTTQKCINNLDWVKWICDCINVLLCVAELRHSSQSSLLFCQLCYWGGVVYSHMNRKTWFRFSHNDMWTDCRRSSTWDGKNVLTVRMSIWNKVSTMQVFDDVIAWSTSKYQFIRGLSGVQEISYDDKWIFFNIGITTDLVCKSIWHPLLGG